MIKTRTITLVLFTGILLLLVGLLLPISIGADEEGVPALQPSPRPPWDATMTPAVQPPLPAPTSSPPSSPTPTAVQPPPPAPTSFPPSSPAPTAALLPLSGGTFSGGWLLGLGAGVALLGLTFAALKRDR